MSPRFAIAPLFHMPTDWPRRLRVGEGADARGSWRPPTDDELTLLVQPAEREASVCLFQLPGHLRAGWWGLLEESTGSIEQGQLPGLGTFVSRVAEFLAFKSLSLPEGAFGHLLVSNPGQSFVPWAPYGPQLWGGINLGDEETSIVLIPQPGDPLRLILGPGEGCRLPRGSLIVGSYPADKQEPDVLLVISDGSRRFA
jgi:hypothetical protein